ncbi:nuclear pore protein 84/107 [Plectosphaerella cucumerina]|uniref:Nuclear pore complex protein n=1 Tax=Plectosphaerella cucumerina TaxID=40658 RepID=A0A8K0TIN0_9PEZI|nr:nuclear pore protein 84/107 [Plectosphaerella cucumerina]
MTASASDAPEVGPEAEIFANELDDCLANHGTARQKQERLLKLIDKYYRYAAEKVDQLGPRLSQQNDDTDMEMDDDEPRSTPDDAQAAKWTDEASTWDLIRRLAPLRYPLDPAPTSQDKRNNSDDDDLWAGFLAQGGLLRERKRVLEWLQHSASRGPSIDDQVRDLQQHAERGDMIAHGWIHSRTAIKLYKSLSGSSRPLDPQSADVARQLLTSTKVPLISQLDPDAVTRQGRSLAPQDEFFERSNWVGCFNLLRTGRGMAEIRDWCVERTEAWRAVSLSGLPLALEGDSPQPKKQAETLALWRRMCYATARQGGTDEVERAVYGVLSGDIQSVEKLCSTWEDSLFMHYNSLLRSHFDDYVLRQCSPEVTANLRQSFAVFDAVQYHGDDSTAEKRIFKSLATQEATRHDACHPSRVLQAAVISKDTSQHFDQQGLFLSNEQSGSLSTNKNELEQARFFSASDFDGLRVAVHVLIITSALEKHSSVGTSSRSAEVGGDRRDLQDTIIAAYVTLLRLARYEELIPLYCSRMLAPRAYEVLSSNLRHIVERERRLGLLNLIEKAGLDVSRFVKTQPQLIMGRIEQDGGIVTVPSGLFRIMDSAPPSLKYGRLVKTDFFGEDPDVIEENDESLIRSLEWLFLVEQTWVDVFSVGVRVYKYFLLTMRLNAARILANRIPIADVLKERLEPLDGQEDADPFWIPDENDGFWASQVEVPGQTRMTPRELATQARAFRDLECLVKALDVMETMSSLMQLSREDSTSGRDFWTTVSSEVKKARACVTPLFDGWLGGGGTFGDHQTTEDLGTIRDTYLPETILAYVSTLHFAGTSLSRDHLLECMDLASIIAQKGSDVAACFVRENRMKDLVESFAACSKALAIATGEKKTAAAGNKKTREMGWSRDLWSVKS